MIVDNVSTETHPRVCPLCLGSGVNNGQSVVRIWEIAGLLFVEETARHCGHLDLTREEIDGQVG